ncbi:hypothetical protein CH063_10965 [Colletotrichum higginsianum]|uniref:Uncharacterized protein n=1 Tax=Colletotrichum higginsianum (strain IMI 349063) TaxID=759273 RepID=H1VJI5_COLHI|nr:hypothetical protein CH63R_02187 [Colletotrichum higginsianum IMI 349063]OBR13461.1 hypothetical protein CH63R_02187 [Colletotrichum higginsianum IMI 349063]CCF40388.1 hypothetical protein CH063_10965 [Colletotrichum higginsianum]
MRCEASTLKLRFEPPASESGSHQRLVDVHPPDLAALRKQSTRSPSPYPTMNAWVVFILLAHVTACSGAISGSKKSGALRKAPVGDYKCVLGGGEQLAHPVTFQYMGTHQRETCVLTLTNLQHIARPRWKAACCAGTSCLSGLRLLSKLVDMVMSGAKSWNLERME